MPPKDASKSKEQDKKNQPQNKKNSKNKNNKNKRRVNIPYARGFRLRTRDYKKTPISKNKIVVEGEDLIIPTPDTFPNVNVKNQVFLCFPANPSFWKGTRIAGLASQYQQYRPLMLKVRYIPQVPVTCPGQVIFGTLFNESVPNSSLQQTLMTSPGGGMVQCYLEGYSNVPCNKDTLPMDLYNLHDGVVDLKCNPFWWLAHYSGSYQSPTTPTTSQPGWIFVKWKYEFTVGKGDTSTDSITINETTSEEAQSSNAFAGWGVALSVLKSIGQRLLAHIGIFLLNETTAYANRASAKLVTKLGVGTTLAVEPNAIVSCRNENTTTVRDADGNELVLSDDTRVCVYMAGQDWTENGPGPFPTFPLCGVELYVSTGLGLTFNAVVHPQFDSSSTGIKVWNGDASGNMYFFIKTTEIGGQTVIQNISFYNTTGTQIIVLLLQVRSSSLTFNCMSIPSDKIGVSQIDYGSPYCSIDPQNPSGTFQFPETIDAITINNQPVPPLIKRKPMSVMLQQLPDSDPYC